MMNTEQNLIAKAVDAAGGYSKVAQQFNISYNAVKKWCKAGRWPRTEATGETRYAETIAKMQSEVPLEELKALAYRPEQAA